MTSIDIIGGGFSGTMVLYHLMQQDLPPMDIFFYDMNGAHGRGVAYGTPMDEHLLNVPASNMSALPDQPSHFAAWLPAGSNPAAFYSRKAYGDYLHAFLDDAVAAASRRGHRLHLLSQAAPQTPSSDVVVYATGTAQPAWPKGSSTTDDPAMIPHPYGAAFAALLARHADIGKIVILGTGLSAVDAILSLDKAGYAGKITAMSRRALWPTAHGPKKHFWQWRKHIDALRPYSNRLWRRMPDAMRRACLKRLTYWNVLRHRMPAPCRAVIRRMEDAGRLRRMKASVLSVQPADGGIQIQTTSGMDIRADAVINCLGHVQPAAAAPVREGSYRVSADKPVFTLGPPLFGYYIESTAVPELRVQARQVAAEIADTIRQKG